MAADVLSDAPESADQYEFSVEDGDVIMLATDGVFDNIPDSILVEEIGILQNGPLDAAKIQVIVCMENTFFLRCTTNHTYICLHRDVKRHA